MARTPTPPCHRNGPLQISCIWQEKWTYLFPPKLFSKNNYPYNHLHKQDIFFLKWGETTSWLEPENTTPLLPALWTRSPQRWPRTQASERWQWHTGWIRPCIVMQLGRRMRWQNRFPLALHGLCARSHRNPLPTPTNYYLTGTVPRKPTLPNRTCLRVSFAFCDLTAVAGIYVTWMWGPKWRKGTAFYRTSTGPETILSPGVTVTEELSIQCRETFGKFLFPLKRN